MQFSALVPMLQTHDMEQTKAWYTSVLGFSLSAESDQAWCHIIPARLNIDTRPAAGGD